MTAQLPSCCGKQWDHFFPYDLELKLLTGLRGKQEGYYWSLADVLKFLREYWYYDFELKLWTGLERRQWGHWLYCEDALKMRTGFGEKQ